MRYCQELKLSFASDICERLLPDYRNFSEKHCWGDLQLLMAAIEESKIELIDIRRVQELIPNVELIIPDMDDFGDGSYALNASAAVLELLEYLIDEDLAHVINISTYMFDTIDFKLSESNPTLTNSDLVNHQELIKERYFQARLLNNVA